MSCDHDYYFSPYCGAKVCSKCDHHEGLARCYCGWSASGGDGRRELIEMGETIEPDDDEPPDIEDTPSDDAIPVDLIPTDDQIIIPTGGGQPDYTNYYIAVIIILITLGGAVLYLRS